MCVGGMKINPKMHLFELGGIDVVWALNGLKP
jgi:hypothetical protein